MTAIFLTVVYAAALWFDFRPRLKWEDKKVLWLYGCLLAASYVVVMLANFNIYLPSPFLPIQTLIETLFAP